MRTLPETAASRMNAAQQNRLANWLCEWALYRSIRRAAVDELPLADDSPSASPFATATRRQFSPSEGYIILLRPVSVTLAEGRPLYVLALKGVSETESFLVAPFSRFATPATDREWRTGLRARPLRVLCLWNVRTISVRAFSTGWLTARLSPRKHQQALKVFEQRLEHNKRDCIGLPAGLGPPLLHPLDPRYDYLAEEEALLDEHLLELESQVKEHEESLLYERSRSPLLKAAEDRPDYGKSQ